MSIKQTHKPESQIGQQTQPVLSLLFDAPRVRLARVIGTRLDRFAEIELNLKQDKQGILNQVIQAISNLFSEEVVGIGVGIPGLVNVEEGIAYNVGRIEAWDEINLREELQNRFGVPVYVNNDANCFALGVKYFGKGKYYRDMVGLMLVGGLGGGVIVDNRLYSGADCGVGEFGHIPYRDSNLESYTSTQFFSKYHNFEFDTVLQQAVSGDKQALQLFTEYGRHLGMALKTIISAVNPQLIVMGGVLVKAFDFFKDSMWACVREFVFQKTIKNMRIEITDDPNIALLGAAALYYDAQEGRALEREKKRRLQAEAELLQERNTLSAILENIPDVIYSKDKNRALLKANRAFLNHYGFASEKEVLGKSHLELGIPKAMQPALLRADKIYKSQKAINDVEIKESDRENHDIWMQCSAIPITDSMGELSGMVGIARDITERKKAEENLKRFSQRLQAAKQETDNILKYVDQGLFLLDSDFKIGSQYADCLTDIFHTKKIARMDLLNYLADKIGSHELETVKRYLEMKFDDSYDESLIEELTPLQCIKLTFKKERLEKFLSFKFRRILNTKGKTSELMAVVKDITEQIRLEERLRASEEKAKKQTELILNIIHLEPSMLRNFITGLKEELKEIDGYFNINADISDYRELLDRLYRSIHLIKGNASILEMKVFAEMAHLFEDKISAALQAESFSEENLEELLDQYDQIKSSYHEMETLISRLSQVHETMRPKRSYEKQAFNRTLENFISQSAQDKGIQVELDMHKFELDHVPYKFQLLVRDTLIQLIRNSLAHGLESREERTAAFKPAAGTITIETMTDDACVKLIYRDDGRGIRLDRLKEKIKESSKVRETDLDALSDQQIAQYIFVQGISTTESSDIVAGRGVGMSAVKEKIEKHGGTINVESQEGKYTRFIFELPASKEDK